MILSDHWNGSEVKAAVPRSSSWFFHAPCDRKAEYFASNMFNPVRFARWTPKAAPWDAD